MKYYMIVFETCGHLNTAFVGEAIDEDFFDDEYEAQKIFNQCWCEGSFKRADELEGSWDYTIILASSEEEALNEFYKMY